MNLRKKREAWFIGFGLCISPLKTTGGAELSLMEANLNPRLTPA
jgi:hypothetical protein